MHDETVLKIKSDSARQAAFEVFFSDYQDKVDCENKKRDSLIKLKNNHCNY